jgi:hypothetical protein
MCKKIEKNKLEKIISKNIAEKHDFENTKSRKLDISKNSYLEEENLEKLDVRKKKF